MQAQQRLEKSCVTLLTITGRHPAREDNPETFLKMVCKKRAIFKARWGGETKDSFPADGVHVLPEGFKKTVQSSIDSVDGGKDGFKRRKVNRIRRGTGLSND